MQLTPDEARRLAGVLLADDDHTDHEDADGLPPGGRLSPGRFGRYQIIRLVGLGGMGEVYEAQQDSPQRRVALKIIRPELVSPELHRRFEYESSTLARLQHPGIAKVFDAGHAEADDGGSSGGGYGSMPYFAMEFVEGKPLTDFARESKLDLRRRLELFLSICDAVEHAHRSGIIHRDLKPANILVDSDSRPRILDFGMARATDHDVRTTTLHTEVGKLIGTLPYMSPEQVAGEVDAVDTRSDVYSLGIILYELLADRPPYEIKRGLIHEAARIIREEDPTPLSSISRTFRGDIETIVAKTLEKEPARRYQSVNELAADLRRFLNDEPIVARRAGTWYQVRKFGRRNKAVVGAAVVVVATLIAASAVSISLLLLQQRTLDDLSAARDAERISLGEARKQAAIAEAVSDFLQNLVTSAGPAAEGPNVTIMQVLQNTRSQVERTFSDQPEVAAAILQAAGRMYRELEDFDRADELLNLAAEYYTAALGPTHPSTLAVRLQIGQVLAGRGQFSEAEELFRSVFELFQQANGFEHADTLWAGALLAVTMGERERLNEAEELARRVVEAQSRVVDRLDAHALTTRGYFVNILQARQRFAEAETLLKSLIADETEAFGPDSLRVASHKLMLALLARVQGRPDDAESLLREIIPLFADALGERHQHTMTARANLVSALASQGRDEEAIVLVREVLAMEQEVLGEEHPNVAVNLGNLAFLLERGGKLEEAERASAASVKIRRSVLGDFAVSTLDSTMGWAEILDKLGRHDEAIKLFDHIVENAAKIDTEPGFYVAAYGIPRGACLIRLRRFEEAEAQLQECLLRFPVAGQRAHNEILSHLVDLYTAWERHDQAQKYADRLEAARQEPR